VVDCFGVLFVFLYLFCWFVVFLDWVMIILSSSLGEVFGLADNRRFFWCISSRRQQCNPIPNKIYHLCDLCAN